MATGVTGSEDTAEPSAEASVEGAGFMAEVVTVATDDARRVCRHPEAMDVPKRNFRLCDVLGTPNLARSFGV
jgi:hypothetical protein